MLYLWHFSNTHHRAGIAALTGAAVLVVIAAIFAKRTRDRRRLVLYSLGSFIGLGLLALGALLTYSDGLRGASGPLDGSLLIRLNGFQSASQMIMEKPVLGIGPGVYV